MERKVENRPRDENGKRLAQINHYPTLYPSSLGPLVFSPGPFGSLPFHSRTELRRTRVESGGRERNREPGAALMISSSLLSLTSLTSPIVDRRSRGPPGRIDDG